MPEIKEVFQKIIEICHQNIRVSLRVLSTDQNGDKLKKYKLIKHWEKENNPWIHWKRKKKKGWERGEESVFLTVECHSLTGKCGKNAGIGKTDIFPTISVKAGSDKNCQWM